MHQCLSLVEILYSIFDRLAAHSQWELCNASTLFALACTCHAFREPALDVLWRDMENSISPLIKCLPRERWELRPAIPDTSLKLILHGPLTADDIRTMSGYATRIRTFGFRGIFSREEVPAEILQVLTLCSDAPLFPNLREICWTHSTMESFPYIRLFLGGSHLQRISLSLADSETIRLSLLPLLKMKYPNVQHASLLVDTPCSQDALMAVSDLISGWDRLEDLSCGPLTHQALDHIASLTALRKLRITLWNISEVTLSRRPAFPALRFLGVRAQHLTTCTSFILELENSSLRAISISLDTPAQSNSFKDFFRAVQHNLPLLTSIHLQELYSTPPHFPDRFTIKVDTLRPLVALSGLLYVKLDPVSTFHLDDQGIAELAQALPLILSLDLGTGYGWRKRSKLTLRSFIPLLKHCTRLIELGIVIDATRVEPSRSLPGAGVFNDRIEILELGDSRISDSAMVAAFLSAMLPSLRTIHAWKSPEMEEHEGANKYRSRWKGAAKLLRVFAMVRDQERCWRKLRRVNDSHCERDESANTSSDASSDEELTDDSS